MVFYLLNTHLCNGMYKNLRLIYITTRDTDEASKIGRDLIEQKLAACVNILPGMKSIYHWDNQLVENNECVLIAKTHYSKVNELTNLVKKTHSYDCPCIVSFDLSENEGNEEYLKWLLGEVTS